jgi:hypothetical protein
MGQESFIIAQADHPGVGQEPGVVAEHIRLNAGQAQQWLHVVGFLQPMDDAKNDVHVTLHVVLHWLFANSLWCIFPQA